MASVRGGEDVDGLAEKLFVAVSKEVKACKLNLLWALQNSGGKRLCLIHVHQPAQTISVLGGRFPLSLLSEQEVRAHREKDRQDMCKILDEYLRICTKAGVQAEKLYIEMNSVDKGIVELISQHKIERLVMGAAADSRYSRKMTEPKSKKANYVRQHAPAFCHTWFICKGHLIYTSNAFKEDVKHSHLNDGNDKESTNSEPRLTQSTSGWSTPHSRVDSGGSFDDFDRASMFSLSQLSGFPRFSSAATDSTLASLSINEERESSSQSLDLPSWPEDVQHHSLSDSTITLQEDGTNDALCDRLDQSVTDAEPAKQEAFQESMKPGKTKKDAIDAICKAKVVENLYYKELRRRIEIEEELAKAKEELESTKKQRDIALRELQAAMDQKSFLERRVEASDIVGKELEERIMYALEFLQDYSKL